MRLVLYIAFLLHERFQIYCYNIDTDFPIVFNRTDMDKIDRYNYFGFSLLLSKNWIIIGAPRANSTLLGVRVKEPGVAYLCKNSGPCEEMLLDKNANRPREDTLKIHDLKDYAWIGGTMAMEHKENGKIVICGHRWKNQKCLNSPPDQPSPNQPSPLCKDKYTIAGICYISKNEKVTLQFQYEVPEETYYLGYWDYGKRYLGLYQNSQIGSSVYIASSSQNSTSLLIGAPGGGRYWSGAVLEYKREMTDVESVRRKRAISVLRPYTKKGFINEFVFPKNYISSYSYFGYQVAAGKFFSKEELCHVASSPRHEMIGTVTVYKVQYKDHKPTISDFQELKGKTFGEYFGNSLAVADVNGDQLDDLIVGAPLFTIKGDEGCIYLFSKNQQHSGSANKYFLQFKERRVGFKANGRFGTTVASLGDLDQDGFDDIAVGAPYENERSGVIYIYNGMKSGLSSKFQRIEAADIHSSIRGFGISIARPADVDGNNFADIAVGAYLSDQVVLLRSHPVIELHSTIESFVNQFNVSENSFTVKVCLYYTGSEYVPDIKVIRNVDVDVNFHRFESVPPVAIELKERNQLDCNNIKIQKKEGFDSKYNVLEDIIILVSQSLISQKNNRSSIIWRNLGGLATSKDADGFCKNCPVVRKSHGIEIHIPLGQDCAVDGKCKSDAELHCELTQNGKELNEIDGYIIGSLSTLKLIVYVRNKQGDPLYYPKVTIVVPKEVELAQIPYSCSDFEGSSLSVVCGFGRINEGEMNSVNISLDFSAYEALRSMSELGLPLSFNVNISRNNYEDPNGINDKCHRNFNLIMMADVNMTGKSVGDIFFSKYDETESNFNHIYEVVNVGMSPIRQVQALFSVPVEWVLQQSLLQFAFPVIEAQHNGKALPCEMFNSNHKSGQNIPTKGVLPVKNMDVEVSLSDEYPSNRTLFLNCSSPNVKCKQWICNFLELKATTVGKIIITPKLNFSKLASVMGHRDIIYFSSYGQVEMLKSYNVRKPDIETYHNIIVSSSAIGTVTKEKIQTWIIIVCIIAGILLILGIVFGLSKAGFFKRQKKEELQALKQSAE